MQQENASFNKFKKSLTNFAKSRKIFEGLDMKQFRTCEKGYGMPLKNHGLSWTCDSKHNS